MIGALKVHLGHAGEFVKHEKYEFDPKICSTLCHHMQRSSFLSNRIIMDEAGASEHVYGNIKVLNHQKGS
jgi:hypothetical protein